LNASLNMTAYHSPRPLRRRLRGAAPSSAFFLMPWTKQGSIRVCPIARRAKSLTDRFGWTARTVLLEAKWTADSQPASSLYQFMGKVSGKLVGTVGLFVSMNGFSADAVDALVAGKELNLILMDGSDFRLIASGATSIADAIRTKLRAAGDSGTPYFALEAKGRPVAQGPMTRLELVLAEGRFDQHVLSTIIKNWGHRADSQIVLPVGGPANFAASVAAHVALATQAPHIVVVADGDDSEAVEERIRLQFEQDLPDIDVDVVVLQPTLEVALGLFGPEELAGGRRKVLQLSDALLLRKIASGIGAKEGEERMAIDRLFELLGMAMPSA